MGFCCDALNRATRGHLTVCSNLMWWTAPVRHRCAKLEAVKCNELEEATHHGDYHDRPGHRQDGLFAKGKFCLIRQGRVALPQRRVRLEADRTLPEVGGIVPRGFCLLGVSHEAAAVDGSAAVGRPCGGATAVGQSLSAASTGHRRARRRAHAVGRSVGRHRGEPPCK